jgi:hypothetical protein
MDFVPNQKADQTTLEGVRVRVNLRVLFNRTQEKNFSCAGKKQRFSTL